MSHPFQGANGVGLNVDPFSGAVSSRSARIDPRTGQLEFQWQSVQRNPFTGVVEVHQRSVNSQSGALADSRLRGSIRNGSVRWESESVDPKTGEIRKSVVSRDPRTGNLQNQQRMYDSKMRLIEERQWSVGPRGQQVSHQAFDARDSRRLRPIGTPGPADGTAEDGAQADGLQPTATP